MRLDPIAAGCLSAALLGSSIVLPGLPALAAPAACGSLTAAAQQACGLAASVPKASDTPNPDDGDAVRVVAPLSAEAYRAVPRDRIVADPGSYLRQPIAVGPSRCFYFGVGDYRCVVAGGTPIVVTAPIVIPQESQVSVEQGCGQGPVGATRACTYRALFVPNVIGRAEPGQSTVVFRAANVMAIPSGDATLDAEEQP